MKQFTIAALAMLITTATVSAQETGNYAAVKQATVTREKKAKAAKQEKREEKKILRKLEGEQVSYFSQQQFAQDFANTTNVSWKRTPYFDEATFQQDGHTMTAFYDIQSKLVGTTEVKALTDLPAAGQKAIAKDYKGYTVNRVILFNDNDANDSDMLLYGVQFEDADNYFVELSNGSKQVIVQVDMSGNLYYFTTMHK